MPAVMVAPVYVEVPDVSRAVIALESHLQKAGYAFHMGDAVSETLEDTKQRITEKTQTHDNDGAVRARVSS